MGTALDALATQPLNTRRAGAPTLPSFELPPPPFALGATSASKYHLQASQAASPGHPPANVSVGNLLTPPATNQPADSATASQALAPSTAAASDLPAPYWAGNPYGAAPHPYGAGANPIYASRSSFSPMAANARSSMTSPTTTDGLSQPMEVHPFSFPQALPAPNSNIPPSAMPHPVTMAGALYHGAGTSASPATLPSNDPYGPKAQPLYGGSPSMLGSHQSGYSPAYGGPAGLGIHPPGRMPAQSSPGGPPSLGFSRQPWPSYSLPAMNGPVMSNVHSPNSPMSMMGSMQPGLLSGFHSGHVASAQHLYPMHQPSHGLSAPAADRPFKCDQCPQSFNRNHDLKRHKRIHLAVKPFPCKHCDKTFSRKDALKRHILVKGCGKDGADDAGVATDITVKGGGASEDGSPVMNGQV